MPAFKNTYVITSQKVIDFYNQNEEFDFDIMNEIMVDLLNKIGHYFNGSTITGNELKQMLMLINQKMDTFDLKQREMGDNLTHLSDIQKLTNENLNSHKEFYVNHVSNALEESKNSGEVMRIIKDSNEGFIERTMVQLKEDFPRMNESIIYQMKSLMLDEFHKSNDKIMDHIGGDKDKISTMLSEKYDSLHDKIQSSIHQYLTQNQEIIMKKVNDVHQISMDFHNFMEIQKNSTLKGKESEQKLEIVLTKMFPNGEIVNQSKEAKSCDYLLKRDSKPEILFENKDYNTNVPNEEIKKFIRDIEYQEKHGIMLSQNSGVNNKNNYQIDIHMGYIMIYVHNVQHDHTLIMNAVQMIDHLDPLLKKHETKSGIHIQLDTLSEINKEYLSFIGQKKQIVESFKKFTKDHLRQLEEFQLSKLTSLLSSKFTNVEQLCYKCDICNSFVGKSKRALVTHKNKCKKIHSQIIVHNNTDHEDVVDLDE